MTASTRSWLLQRQQQQQQLESGVNVATGSDCAACCGSGFYAQQHNPAASVCQQVACSRLVHAGASWCGSCVGLGVLHRAVHNAAHERCFIVRGSWCGPAHGKWVPYACWISCGSSSQPTLQAAQRAEACCAKCCFSAESFGGHVRLCSCAVMCNAGTRSCLWLRPDTAVSTALFIFVCGFV